LLQIEETYAAGISKLQNTWTQNTSQTSL